MKCFKSNFKELSDNYKENVQSTCKESLQQAISYNRYNMVIIL